MLIVCCAKILYFVQFPKRFRNILQSLHDIFVSTGRINTRQDPSTPSTSYVKMSNIYHEMGFRGCIIFHQLLFGAKKARFLHIL